jgi:hypothetical protein
MAIKSNGAASGKQHNEVMRVFVRGRLAQKPEFAQTMDGVAICRLLVLGKAAGPASSPPRVSLYLHGAEAKRCAFGLNEGDLIEGIGDLGPERRKARRQEVVVSERVKLRERAAA